jgi:XTP/dITP diphosphohydrolase
VKSTDVKGIEIQSDELSDIAKYASSEASKKLGKPVIVEDAGLFIDSLNGFPGPYSSYVYRKLKVEGLLTLLQNIHARLSRFKSVVAYCEPHGEPRIFEGEIVGWITTKSRGVNGFGFDPIFIPEGSVKTLAEMPFEQKCKVSHRGKSMRNFAIWFTTKL